VDQRFYTRRTEASSEVNSIFGKIAKNRLEIRETNSAIKGFTKQYTIHGIEGVDAASFLRRQDHRLSACWEASEEQRSL